METPFNDFLCIFKSFTFNIYCSETNVEILFLINDLKSVFVDSLTFLYPFFNVTDFI